VRASRPVAAVLGDTRRTGVPRQRPGLAGRLAAALEL